MEQVKNFLHSSAKEGSTEVCTETAAPVTQEHITKHEHVETAEAIDRERHIHHHQHRVQPVAATETLATQHETNIVPEITREQRHELPAEHEARLKAQHAQYADTTVVGETERTAAHLGTSVNEHTHHHVHEHIQPVIQKETHAHKTVHTVIPVHEKIHEAPIVHESTVLPTVSLDEFSRAHAGSATETHGASAHKHAFYEGEPKAAGTTGVHSHTDKNHHHGKEGVQPVHNSQALNQADPRVDSDRTTGVAHTGVGAIGNQDTTTHAAVPGATSTSGKPVGSAVAGSGATATHPSTTTATHPSTTTAETTPHKKSLVEKIKDVL